jgi:hypothetical protein
MAAYFFLLITLFTIGCSKNRDNDDKYNYGKNKNFFDYVGEVKVYEPSHLNIKALETCAYRIFENNCDDRELNFLAQDNAGQISISDIKKRIVTQETWLADNFIYLLENIENNDDLMAMFGSVKLIVLSNRISSAFYAFDTASIYLPSNFLQLSISDTKKSEQQGDDRSARAKDFSFFDLHILKQNQYYLSPRSYNLKDNKYLLASVLYHELAHAADYFSFEELKLLPIQGKINSDLEELVGGPIDSEIKSNFDNLLKSELLKSFAHFKQYGEGLSFSVDNIDALVARDEIKSDCSLDFYSYTNQREYFAQMIRTFLLKKNHNIDTYLVIIEEKEYNKDNYLSSKVFWGEKNRMSDDCIFDSAISYYKSLFPKDLAKDFNFLKGQKEDLSGYTVQKIRDQIQ